jgi:hypothetical protein
MTVIMVEFIMVINYNNTNNNSIIQYRICFNDSFWCKDVNIPTDNINNNNNNNNNNIINRIGYI